MRQHGTMQTAASAAISLHGAGEQKGKQSSQFTNAIGFHRSIMTSFGVKTFSLQNKVRSQLICIGVFINTN